MPIDVVMPRLGWTMEAGTVVEWLKASGDPVEAGEMLFSVESDKAITEVEALDSGILFVPPDAPIGTEVPVGSTVGYILSPGEAPPSPAAATESAGGQIPPLPRSGEGQGQRAVHAAATESGGGQIPPLPRSGEGLGVRAISAAISPRARRIAAELGVDLATVTGTGRTGRIREADVRAAAAMATNGARQRMSPAVRRLAEEAGVDLSAVASSGPAGRVTRSDLLAASGSAAHGAREATVVPMSAFRRAISQRMTESVRTVAPVTLTTEADASELVRTREALKAELAGSGDALPSYNDLLTRLVARALRLHPQVNASVDGDRILLHQDVHIGLAVDTERGLLAPVIRHADRLGVFDIAAESARLIGATRDGSVGRDSLSGATFTITNLGMFDIDAFTPIINLPEAAVLGVGRIVAKPVVIDEETGDIGVRRMMALSLTFDHRIVDGAPAARFLQQIKQMVEQPLCWLM